MYKCMFVRISWKILFRLHLELQSYKCTKKKNCMENIIMYQLKNTNIAVRNYNFFNFVFLFFYTYKAKVDIFSLALLQCMLIEIYDKVHMIKHLGRLRRRSSDISFGWFRIIRTTCNLKNIQNTF